MIITQTGRPQPPKVVVTIRDTTNGTLHEANITQCTLDELVEELRRHGIVQGDLACIKVLSGENARIRGDYVLQNGDFIEFVEALCNGMPSAPVRAAARELFDMLDVGVGDFVSIGISKDRTGTILSYTGDRRSNRALPAYAEIVGQLHKLMQALGVHQALDCAIYIEKSDEDDLYVTFD
jgi:hypothetical protein